MPFRPYRIVFHPVLVVLSSTSLALAQIVADPSALRSQQPTVLRAGNGIAVVDIQTPNAAGVSRNRYRQFDIPTGGAVLNNSRGSVQTRLGGWVQGNPWLAGGGARVIVNEVDSTRPSQLRGALEVAGQRAQVVVANPSGISCDGCGFIHADRSTLTTGTPFFEGDTLGGFRVRGGTVTVSGAGFDATGLDHAQVLARAMEVNAGIWANALTVKTGVGAMAVDADGVVVEAGKPAGAVEPGDVGPRPSFALDVAAIGGMYAGRIFLVGTEAGLGVRNAGHLGAEAGRISLTVDGRIENTGSITASGDVTVGGMEVDNRGSITADAAVVVSAGAALTNGGTVRAGGSMTLSSVGRMDNTGTATATSTLAVSAGAALDNRGTLYGRRSVDVAAGSHIDHAGLIGSFGSVRLAATGSGAEVRSTTGSTTAAGLSQQDGRWTMEHAPASNLIIGGSLVALHGQLLASGAIDLAVPRLDVSGAEVVASQVRLAAMSGDLDASRARITSTGTLGLDAAGAVRTDAATLSGVDVVIRGGALSNLGGDVLAGERLEVSVGQLRNAAGRLTAVGAASVTASVFDNASGIVEGSGLAVKAGTLSSAGLLFSHAGADIEVVGTLTNAGTIAVGADLRLAAGTVDNARGVIAASGDQQLVAGALDNRHGRIAADGSLQALVAGDVDNTGGTVAASRLALSGRGLRNDSGLIDADRAALDVRIFDNGSGNVLAGDLSVSAGSLGNGGGRLQASGDLRLSVADAIDNRLGTLRASGRLHLSAGSVSNHGTIDADGEVRVTSSGALLNRGVIEGSGSVSLVATDVDNRGGRVRANGSLDLRGAGSVDNTDGELIGLASIEVAARRLDNTRGLLESAGSVTLRDDRSAGSGDAVAPVLHNDQGVLIAGSLDLRLSRLSNVGGQVSADRLSVEAGRIDNGAGLLQQTGRGPMRVVSTGSFDNTGGRVIANGDVQVAARELSNRGGSITAASVAGSHVPSSLDVSTTGAVDNTLGTLASTGDTTVDASALDNTQGRVTAGRDVGLQVDGRLTNTGGSVAARGSARLTAALVDNAGGSIVANGRIDVAAGGIDNAGGTLAADGLVRVTAARIDNTGGTIASFEDALAVVSTGSDAIAGRGGRMQSALGLRISGAGLDNTGGHVSGGDVAIDTGTAALRNAGGSIVAAGRLDVASGALDNEGGRLQARAALTVDTHGGALTNTRSGEKNGIVGLAGVTLRTGDLDNTAGFVGARGDLSISASALMNGQGGVFTGEASVAASADAIDNSGGAFEAVNALLLEASDSIDNSRGWLSGSAVVLRDRVRAERVAGLADVGPRSAAARKTLEIVNDGGSIVAETSLRVDSARLVGTGTLASHGSLAVALDGDHRQTGVFEAGGDASLAVTGALINETVMRAGGTLTVDAATIENTALAEMSGRTAVVRAAGSLTNRGLIDGEDTRLTADAVDNLGTGRIYGDAVAVSARALRNDVDDAAATPAATGAVASALRPAGTIASRGRLDLGVQTLVNREGALLLGMQDMAIGGSLDVNRRATGRAASVANASATIEALGALTMSADRIDNTNEHFETEMRTVASDVVRIEHALTSGGRHYGSSEVRLVELLADGAGSVIYRTHDAADTAWLGDRDRRQLLLPSADYPFDRFAAYYASSEATVPSGDYPAGECRDVCDPTPMSGRHYAASDPIWSTFGVDPAAGDMALDTALFAFRSSLQRRAVADWDYFRTTTRETTPVTVRSDPARIASGGDMTLLAGDIVNDKSRIVAGGDLIVRGAAVRNLGAVATSTVQSIGAAVHTSVNGCSSCDDGRVHRSTSYDTSVSHRVELGLGEVITHAALSGGRTVEARKTDGAPTEPGGGHGAAVDARGGDAGDAGSNPVGAVVVVGGDGAGGAAMPPRVVAPSRPGGGAGLGPTDADAARSSILEVAAAAIGQAGSSGAGAANRLDPSVIRTARPGITVPVAGLFRQNPAPTATWLVETDPRFADQRQWLGSDYLLDQLKVDAAVSQKRLGDGFYEQQLLREQVAQLTGRRFLDGYVSDEAEFRALMDAGVLTARRVGLRPGIELTADQMAALTSDIVWLVERSVTLGDGSTQQVLVPQLYARVKPGDVSGDGALLAGRDVDVELTGDFVNSATVAGRGALVLNARNVDVLGGRIAAGTAIVQAANDLSVIGGTIDAVSGLRATAGRDLRIASTSSETPVSGASALDRVAGLYVSGDAAALVARAGRDATLTAAKIANSGEGGSTLVRGERDLVLDTLRESSAHTIVWDAKNVRQEASTKEVGTTVSAVGSISLQAGGDAVLRAANVTSASGAADVSAGRDVILEAGEATARFDEAHSRTARKFLGRQTTTTHDASTAVSSVGTLVSGETTAIDAGRDLAVRGSDVVSTDGTLLVAGRHATVEATTGSGTESHSKSRADTGLFSGGGMGVTLGRRDQTREADEVRTTASASTVGSTAGNVVIRAGGAYRQAGSDVLAPEGDIDIRAARVDIVEARESERRDESRSVKQAGVSVGIRSGIVDAVDKVVKSQETADATDDGRMQLLAAATAAATARQAAAEVAANPRQGGGVNVSISLGASSNRSRSSTASDTGRASSVAAGGNVGVVATATGGAPTDGQPVDGLGDLTARGARLSAGDRVTLQADRTLELGASKDTATQDSSNRSSSGSVGISYGTSGLMFNAGAAAGRGSANGDDVVQRNTVVTAGRQVTLASGGDTSLRGAVVAAEQVTADVGGDLRIESLQDTSTFASRQASVGASVSIGYGQSSGSFNASKTAVDSTYGSVGQQSGIRAGDGGFQVDVTGVTMLKGGVVASTEKAVTDGANRFASAEVVTSDIADTARFSARSVGVDLSGGSRAAPGTSSGVAGEGAGGVGAESTSRLGAGDKPGGAGGSSLPGAAGLGSLAMTGSGMGVGKESGSAGSTTVAGISGIAGNATVRSTDAETGIAPIFDAGKVQASVAAQAQLTQAFSRQAPKAVAEFAAGQAAGLDAQARVERDPARRAELQAEAARWQEGGAYRVALHTAAGALGGGAAGAGGAAVSAAAAPLLDQLQAGVTDALSRAGLDASAAKLAAQSLASLTAAGAGAAAGGVAGSAAGVTVDSNNRQLHPVETQRIKELARGDTRAEQRLVQAACALVRCADGVPSTDPAYASLRALQDAGASLTAEQQLLSEQKGLDGRVYQPLFRYTTGQAFGDLLDQTQAGTRALGAAQAGAALVGGVGGMAPCATGVGCLVSAAGLTVSADHLQAGVRTALNGAVTPTQGELVLRSFGVDPRTAEAAYGVAGAALGSGAVVKAADGVGAAVANKGLLVAEQVETRALLDARGVIDPRTGASILDLKPFTNAQKGMVGEYLGEQTVRGIVPDGVKISRTQTVGQNGIDDLYKVARPDLDYLMIEYKVVGDWDRTGSAALRSTKDGLQASESWFQGGNRLDAAVGRAAALDVRASIAANRTETWVVTIRPDGSSEIQVLDSFARPKAVDASKFVLPARP